MQDACEEAKHRKVILSHGASVHGLPALRKFPGNKFLEIAMIRMNHDGTRMDAEVAGDPHSEIPGNVPENVTQTKKVHAEVMDVISMKLIGEGRYTNANDREKAIKHTIK